MRITQMCELKVVIWCLKQYMKCAYDCWNKNERGIWIGCFSLRRRSATIRRLRSFSISSRKKSYRSFRISCTIDWNPPNHEFVISVAEELKRQVLSSFMRKGKWAGLQYKGCSILHRTHQSPCVWTSYERRQQGERSSWNAHPECSRWDAWAYKLSCRRDT